MDEFFTKSQAKINSAAFGWHTNSRLNSPLAF
jgi:hypothetical protein